ncbi:putative inorganic phosphate cotransporter isoform X3 [Macrobrachium nipponense]|uniref:putative inorganic phosphate cotransporter isoform X3 n=1 Tax=Macrobrachium nipponense TaxID=159736 RepID=UPI0030C8BFB6
MDKSDEKPKDWKVSSVLSVGLPDDKQHHPAEEQKDETAEDRGWTDRHTLVLMTLMGQCMAFMIRGSLSVAIVAMVSSNSSSTHGHGAENHVDVCPVPPCANCTLGLEKEGEFDWDEQLQGLVLGAHFYGYLSSCFVAGLVVDHFGGRLMYGVSNLGMSILSVLAPVSVRTSVWLLITNKVLSGLIQLKDIDFKRVLTSLPFWALVSFHIGDNFGYYLLSSEMPTYLSNIQHLDLNKNGLLSSLPYTLQSSFSMVWGIFISGLTISGRISVLTARRISSAVGMYGAGLALVVMCFVNCNVPLAVGVLCIAVGITGASNSGGHVGEQDICPQSLVGVITGMGCMASAATGFLAPLVTGSIIMGNETLPAWRTAFLIAAGVYFITGTFYQTFVTDKVQPWIKIKENAESSKS